jgi:hypothetical protein
MRYRLRTLLIWVALVPPLIAVAVMGLERTYFNAMHWLRSRMAQPNPVQPTHKITPPPSVAQDSDDPQPESP